MLPLIVLAEYILTFARTSSVRSRQKIFPSATSTRFRVTFFHERLERVAKLRSLWRMPLRIWRSSSPSFVQRKRETGSFLLTTASEHDPRINTKPHEMAG